MAIPSYNAGWEEDLEREPVAISTPAVQLQHLATSHLLLIHIL